LQPFPKWKHHFLVVVVVCRNSETRRLWYLCFKDLIIPWSIGCGTDAVLASRISFQKCLNLLVSLGCAAYLFTNSSFSSFCQPFSFPNMIAISTFVGRHPTFWFFCYVYVWQGVMPVPRAAECTLGNNLDYYDGQMKSNASTFKTHQQVTGQSSGVVTRSVASLLAP
jgi:hypothetical protein